MSASARDTPGHGRRSLRLWAVIVPAALAIAAVVSLWALTDPDDDPLRPLLEPAYDRVADWIVRSWPVTPTQTNWEAQSMDIRGADPEIGRQTIVVSGCGSCHTIPGVANANGSVGPNLTDFAERAYVAGILPNRPGDLTRWLVNPPAIAPDTAMPDLGLNETQARHIAAYLYTLGDVR
ncbi:MULTISPECIES: c-type cytochrome [unclassified Roseitalea]|uniref:c-type cytochrome n=1 Tax=unclassified Roseitalea TaxID=2639107 RepID=UPI00273E2D5B|nr:MULTISPECIES: c-type cytochrome [unclassified Roseitalea]